jgi:SAM-dependent methyltransferase
MMLGMATSDTTEQIRSYWDEDAAGYDRTPGHYPQTPAEWAAWRGALEPLLPPAPARVLDVGAGTGFLTIAAAGLGHEVTAVDLSGQMLARLTAKASAQQLTVTAIQASADQLPREGFDVVMSRHLLWTLAPPPPAAGCCWWKAYGAMASRQQTSSAPVPGGWHAGWPRRLRDITPNTTNRLPARSRSRAACHRNGSLSSCSRQDGAHRGCAGSPAWNGSWAASCPGQSG